MKHELTKDEWNLCLASYGHQNDHAKGLKALRDRVIEIISARLQPPGWKSYPENQPTEADGLSGSTNPSDDGAVYWMVEGLGITWWSRWSNPPTGAVAYLPIPAYAPPVPTAEEISRKEFEAWFDGADMPNSRKPMALEIWQAARAKGGQES